MQHLENEPHPLKSFILMLLLSYCSYIRPDELASCERVLTLVAYSANQTAGPFTFHADAFLRVAALAAPFVVPVAALAAPSRACVSSRGAATSLHELAARRRASC